MEGLYYLHFADEEIEVLRSRNFPDATHVLSEVSLSTISGSHMPSPCVPSPPSPQGHHRDCQSPPPTPRGHNPALLTCNDLILGAPFLPRLDNLLPWYSQPQPRRPLPAPSPQGAPGPMFGWAPGGLGSL